MFYLCERFNTTPDDPKIRDMDEIMMNWFFYNWLESKEEKAKFMKDFGCFVGSFYNYKMAKEIMGNDSNSYETSDDEFNAAADFVRKSIEKNNELRKNNRKRKKKIVLSSAR